MRISDWSSDVCSSDLLEGKKLGVTNGEAPLILLPAFLKASNVDQSKVQLINADAASKDVIMVAGQEIGRASCRERVCQYVSISVVAVSLKQTPSANNHTHPGTTYQTDDTKNTN